MKKIVQHIDGFYVREFPTGRKKVPVETKAVHTMITQSPKVKEDMTKWCENNNIKLSTWIEQQICKTIYIETV